MIFFDEETMPCCKILQLFYTRSDLRIGARNYLKMLHNHQIPLFLECDSIFYWHIHTVVGPIVNARHYYWRYSMQHTIVRDYLLDWHVQCCIPRICDRQMMSE